MLEGISEREEYNEDLSDEGDHGGTGSDATNNSFEDIRAATIYEVNKRKLQLLDSMWEMNDFFDHRIVIYGSPQ